MLPETDYTTDGPPNGGDRVEQPGVPGVQCSICSSTFRRPEHLKRHLRSHTKEKPFECAQCGRHFSRTDTLHRHELSHHTQGSDGGKDRTHRITVKTFRACFGCAMARVRCSGGNPCGRCGVRSLECQYPTERRSKAKARNGNVTGSTESQTPQFSSPYSYRNDIESDMVKATSSFQTTLHPIHDFDGSQRSPDPTIQIPGKTQAHLNASNRRASVAGASNSQLDVLPSTNYASTATQIPLTVHPKNEYSQAYNQLGDTPKVYTSESMADLSYGPRHTQPNLSVPDVDMSIDMPIGSGIPMEFQPSFFDQSMGSTINWLPTEDLASGNLSQQPGNSLQYSQSDSYTGRVAWQPPIVDVGRISSSQSENVAQTPSGIVSLGTDMGSPREHSKLVSEASCATVDLGKMATKFNTDGDGGPKPKDRKREDTFGNSSLEDINSQRPLIKRIPRKFDFPGVQQVCLDKVSEQLLRSLKPIETSTYNQLHAKFLQLCHNENPFFQVFDSKNFPSADECNRYMACFFESFQPVYPIIHPFTFDPNICHWLLTLALVTIGCNYLGTPEALQSTVAFHEMIRRGFLAEENKGNTQHSLDMVQAMSLNCIGLLHSENEDDKRSALRIFSELVTISNDEKLLACQTKLQDPNNQSDDVRWTEWIQQEVRKRTGYFIWYLDSAFAIYFDERPFFSLDDGKIALPVHERVWQANTAEAWKQQWETSTTNVSLYDAVHMLYIEKRLTPDISEFSHVLLIHALYHRMWEVGDYFRRPLSFWNPTVKKQPRDTAIPAGSVWLPGIPSYSKWRNSACDCLDILHWTADGTMAKVGGFEHPTVLQLHVARLILLAPFREIRSLAISLACDESRWQKRHQTLEWQYIWRWVNHDQYKARLSIIHAGLELWHVRRYSKSAFHEPVATFLAVLILWAYGCCKTNGSHKSSPESGSDSAEISQRSNIIHLDRPCDDELVQLFVREGYAMRGNLIGVGDICAWEGPERVLRVGCETLSCLKSWGISKRFITILTQLADIMSQNRELEQSQGATLDDC